MVSTCMHGARAKSSFVHVPQSVECNSKVCSASTLPPRLSSCAKRGGAAVAFGGAAVAALPLHLAKRKPSYGLASSK